MMEQETYNEMLDRLSKLKVVKRDGRLVKFNNNKIHKALKNTAKQVYGSLTPLVKQDIENVVFCIDKEIDSRFNENIKIYEIQSIVEHELLEHDNVDLAEAYTQYRLEHDIKRQQQTSVEYNVKRLFNKDDDVVNENANKDSDLYSTYRDLTAGAVDKAIGLQKLPREIANAHLDGIIHWHDLDYSPATPMTNCCLIDLKSMLSEGYTLGNAEVESPKSIQTAVAQTSQILANISSSQYGGSSYNRIDEVLAPYAKLNYDKHYRDAAEWIEDENKWAEFAKKKTKKDIKDAMQALEYEINSLFTSNGQTPFSTIGFGLGENWFEREIQIAILEQRIAGLGKAGKTAIFPKLLFTIKPGLNMNPEDPNYDIKQLALKSVVKRMSPEILNYDNVVDITGSFKASMGK